MVHSHEEAQEGVLVVSAERFERRLVEEIAGVRVQIAQVEGTLRQEIGQQGSDLRQEIGQLRSDLRQEIGQLGSGLRQEMALFGATVRTEMGESRAGLRDDIAAVRVDLFKWSFIFWIGQVVAITGIMGVMLRLAR